MFRIPSCCPKSSSGVRVAVSVILGLGFALVMYFFKKEQQHCVGHILFCLHQILKNKQQNQHPWVLCLSLVSTVFRSFFQQTHKTPIYLIFQLSILVLTPFTHWSHVGVGFGHPATTRGTQRGASRRRWWAQRSRSRASSARGS